MKIGNGNPFILAIVAFCAVGTVIFGTLAWKDNQAQNATPTATLPPAPAAPPPMSTQANVGNSGLPAQPSTAGMNPGQAALAMANWYYDAQQWPQAIEKYRFALTHGLDSPDVRTDYGNSLRFAGQPQKALEQYNLAQKQDPRHEQSLFNQGGLWEFALGNNAKAVAAWHAYLKRFPQGESADQAREFIKKYEKK
jgi:tetratricopeptide (TPR) repeat protein